MTTTSPQRIAIIGAGSLGAALARGWAARGHDVALGVREPSKPEAVKGGTPAGVRVTSVADAITNADVVVVATPARVMTAVVEPLRGKLAGRVVIDATNPVGPGLQLLTGEHGESQAERMQQLLPDARVVKCFNQTGANNIPYAGRTADGRRPVMFVAGDDASACTVAASLADELGFESIQAGALLRARELERLAMLWIALSASPTAGLGRAFTFAVDRG